MAFKITEVKDKLLQVIKAAGVEIPEGKADAVFAAVAAVVPDGELFTKDETQQTVTAARDEAKRTREAVVGLVEKITGMRRDQFAEANRFDSMLQAADQKVVALTKELTDTKATLEPLQQSVEKYRTAEAAAVKQQWMGVGPKLTAILSDAKNKELYAKRFATPEAGKELTAEQMQANVATFTELQQLGVPAFQSQSNNHEQTPNPSSSAQGERPYDGMTVEELEKRRSAA